MPRSALALSPLSFGGAAIAGLFEPVPEHEAMPPWPRRRLEASPASPPRPTTGWGWASEVLVGARSALEVRDAVRAFTTPVPAALWDELRRRSVVGAEAPI